MMERRSFLKLLGIVTGGSLLLPEYLIRAPTEGERIVEYLREKYESEFFFELGGVDFGPWLNIVEPPTLDQRMLDVTTFDDPFEKFIPIGPPEVRLGFTGDVPEDKLQALLEMKDVVEFRLGHRPSGWSWSGQCFLKQLVRRSSDDQVTADIAVTGGPVTVHCG
jgi:hypothetical protein